MYLDREDDVLDFCKRVIFNPLVGRKNASADYEKRVEEAGEEDDDGDEDVADDEGDS
jgi:hypothetical protein